MLTVLIVGATGAMDSPLQSSASVEILHTRGLEGALETLGRNRRIDAILLCAEGENAEIAAAIRHENPAPPPIFATGAETPRGVRSLPSGSPADSLNRLLEIL